MFLTIRKLNKVIFVTDIVYLWYFRFFLVCTDHAGNAHLGHCQNQHQLFLTHLPSNYFPSAWLPTLLPVIIESFTLFFSMSLCILHPSFSLVFMERCPEKVEWRWQAQINYYHLHSYVSSSV